MQQKNAIRILLDRNESVFGATAITQSPVVIEVYADIGLDYVWLDYEHAGPSTSNGLHLASIRRTADAADIEPVVRVQSPDPSEVRKVLDAGIHTYVVPRIKNAEQVREIIEVSKFEYDGASGGRGLGTCLGSNWGNPPNDYTTMADNCLLPGIMIENKSALRNIDDIFSVPELGFAQIGPTDLSVALGHPLERDHPRVREAIDTVLDAGTSHNVPIGVSSSYVNGVETAVERGFDLIKISNDIGAVRRVLSDQYRCGIEASERTGGG
jgi:2-dehydro-3-deoxyglucarate aldolase